MPLIATLILSFFLIVNKIFEYFILVSLNDLNALKTTFNLKNIKICHHYCNYERWKIMPSISQEDSENRGKNIENFNEKCTCIYYKCVEYFFLNQRTLLSCVQFSD